MPRHDRQGGNSGTESTLDLRALVQIDPAAPAILPRLFAQIANEAAFALEEEIAAPRRHGHGDAARLQLAPGARSRIAELIGPVSSAGDPHRPGGRARRGLPPGDAPARGGGDRWCLCERRAQAGLGADRAAQPRGVAATHPFDDEEDFAEATRELVAAFEPATVPGRVRQHAVWDLESYEFLDGEPPDTVDPSLWRQSRLNWTAGLFEVAPASTRSGLRPSNMTIVEGDTGIIVIDPLISAESAAAALASTRAPRRATGPA